MAKWFSDLGHGGNDPGAVGSGKRESDICLAAGLEFKKVMEANGEVVKLSRESDKTLSLTERTNMANSWGADYVISKHVNAAGPTAKGTETFIYRDSGNSVDTKSKKLAQLCNKHTLNAVREMGITQVDRGVKVSNLHMVRETVAPACLVELEFISNPNIAPNLNGVVYGRHLAYACLEMVGKTVSNNQNNNVGVKNMKNAVIYTKGEEVDKCLAEFFKLSKEDCAMFHTGEKIDYTKFDNVYAVGGKIGTYTSYLKVENFMSGANRGETAKAVLRKLGYN